MKLRIRLIVSHIILLGLVFPVFPWLNGLSEAAGRYYYVSFLPGIPEGNTRTIQRWIDSCSKRGGGKVVLPGGKIYTGTLFIKSHVVLQIPSGTELIGDTRPELFPLVQLEKNSDWYRGKEGHHQRALIVAINQRNIGIEGEGSIDGQGEAIFKAFSRKAIPFRWMVLWFRSCRNIRISGIRLRSSPSWMQLYQNCTHLNIDSVSVSNFGAKNNDGLDLDGCRLVSIRNCRIDSDDDALVLKSLSPQPMRDVSIENCGLSSNCNALKVGTESEGNISNISARDIVIVKAGKPSAIYRRNIGLAGIALCMVDGGQLRSVYLKNISIEGVKVPLFMRQGIRNRRSRNTRKRTENSRIENVWFEKITSNQHSDFASHITAVDSGNIRNVIFRETKLMYNPVDSLSLGSFRTEMPALPESYPEATLFGRGLPEVVLFARGVSDLDLSGVTIKEGRVRQSGLPALYTPGCTLKRTR